MRILGITNRDSGCGFHRVFMPLGYVDIPGTIWVSNYIPVDKRDDVPEDVNHCLTDGWDIVIYNRMCQYDKNFKALREYSGAKIIIDMDDCWDLPPGHINYDEYRHFSARIENNLREADAVTCTHERLAEKCRGFNENVHVIPNALPFGEFQYGTDKVDGEAMRLFWAGGISHQGDIELLRQPMKRISTIKGVNVTIGGYNRESSEIWDKMVSAFTNGLKIPGSVLESLPPTQYMEHHKHGDIMLVPLIANDWSAMKSNLKLLEAAAKRMPAICSRVLPYTEFDPPVLWVEKQSDWYRHVNYLMNNREKISEYGEALFQWANSRFNLFDVSKKRRELFYQLVPQNQSLVILEKHKHYYDFWNNHGELVNFDTGVQDELLGVYRKEREPGYTYNRGCSDCVIEFLMKVYNSNYGLYYSLKL